MVNSNYVGKEAITGIMFGINYETVKISLKSRLNILILSSTFYSNSMKIYFNCIIITVVRLPYPFVRHKITKNLLTPRSLSIYLKPNYNIHGSSIVLEYTHTNFFTLLQIGPIPES